MDFFDHVWDEHAKNGLCDARGSAEYQRVRKMWEDFGRVSMLANFIIVNVNPGMSVSITATAPEGGGQ